MTLLKNCENSVGDIGRAYAPQSVSKRQYRYVGIDWSDAEMRREYNRRSQRAWRAKHRVGKRGERARAGVV